MRDFIECETWPNFGFPLAEASIGSAHSSPNLNGLPIETSTDKLNLTADVVKSIIRADYASDNYETSPAETDKTDKLLYGFVNVEAERLLNRFSSRAAEVRSKYPRESYWIPGGDGIWTPYGAIKDLVKNLDLDNQSTLYDLGCGYGRFVLYSAIVTDAKCKGIEIMPDRAELAQQAQAKLELENAEFIEGNVLEQDYSDGDVFYMYLPFSLSTFRQVLDQLRTIAEAKPIRIAARGGRGIFGKEEWLRNTGYTASELLPKSAPLYIFESV